MGIVNSIVSRLPLNALMKTTWEAPGNSLNEWPTLQQKQEGRITVQLEPGGREGRALRFEVHIDDELHNGVRAEVARSDSPKQPEQQGMIALFRWSTLLDPAYPAKAYWQVITQWHQNDIEGHEDLGVSPPVAFAIVQPDIHLQINEPTPPHSFVVSHPVAEVSPGQWHNFQLLVRWSTGSDAAIVVWHNGTIAARVSGKPTLFPTEASPNMPGSNYMKMGIYRERTDDSDVLVVYHNGVQRREFAAWVPSIVRSIIVRLLLLGG